MKTLELYKQTRSNIFFCIIQTRASNATRATSSTSGFRKNLKELTKTPIWMLHAADDMVVKASYKTDGFSAHLGSRDIYEELKGIHPDLHYTEYEAGEMKERYGINPHCSWVPAGQDDEVKEWLFSKSK